MDRYETSFSSFLSAESVILFLHKKIGLGESYWVPYLLRR